MYERRRGGFTMIEILVVLAIIAILSAMVIANYTIGLQRARQKRTMADMRSIAVAWEARAVEYRAYNAAGATFTFPSVPVTSDELKAILMPTYSKVFPVNDGWMHPFDFAIDQTIGAASQASTYAIRSGGADGIRDASEYEHGPTNDFDCDIVYSSGHFLVYPAVK